MMARRTFLAGTGAVLLASPLAVEAQQWTKIYRIGELCPTQCLSTHPLTPPFWQGLRDFGWIEGQNFVFDYRHAMGHAEQLPGLATELVNTKPDALFAPSPSAAQALKKGVSESIHAPVACRCHPLTL